MSEANAAYGRQDLMALLHLQLQIAQADSRDLAQQPAEKIAAVRCLLTQQAAELESELFARKEYFQQEFDLQPHQIPTAPVLDNHLALQAQDLKDALAVMQADLQAVQDDAGLKRWLKMQTKKSRNADYS